MQSLQVEEDLHLLLHPIPRRGYRERERDPEREDPAPDQVPSKPRPKEQPNSEVLNKLNGENQSTRLVTEFGLFLSHLLSRKTATGTLRATSPQTEKCGSTNTFPRRSRAATSNDPKIGAPKTIGNQ